MSSPVLQVFDEDVHDEIGGAILDVIILEQERMGAEPYLPPVRFLRACTHKRDHGRMSARGANRTRRDGGNDVNDPGATLVASQFDPGSDMGGRFCCDART